MEQIKRSPREQAELILNWARTHILSPCGNTPRERAFMRKTHREVIKGALEEPGVGETLTPEEQEELEGLLEK